MYANDPKKRVSHETINAHIYAYPRGGLRTELTAGYVQIAVEALRAPAQRAANKMKRLCGVAPARATNVVTMRSPAA
jgi:hypothetical protein